MKDESDITIRHAGLLTLQRIAYVVGSFAFAVVVPRVLGAAFYGQYAFTASVSAWFALLGSMGLGQMVGRYVPLFVHRKDSAGLHEFFGHLLAARFSGCLAAAALFYVFCRIALPDLSPLILIPASGILLIGALSELIYSFFWGLNRAAWWGMGDLIRRMAQIALIVPGFFWLGLPGAFWGMFCVELLVLAVGLWRARPFLDKLRVRPDLRYLGPYARFGLLFSLNDLLLTLVQRSGEILIRIFTSDYAVVGQFALGYAVYMTFAAAVSQIVFACLPAWTSLQQQNKPQELARWLERLIAWLAACGFLAIFGLLFLGDRWIPLVLGHSFRPVTAYLFPLLLILPLLPLTSIAGTIALMQNRPGLAVQTTAGLLAGLWILSSIAIPRWCGIGVCASFLVSMILYTAHFVWRIRSAIRIPLGRWMGVVACGGFFILFGNLLPAAYRGLTAFVFCSAGFAALLFAARIIRSGDAVDVWRAFQQGHAGSNLPLADPVQTFFSAGDK